MNCPSCTGVELNEEPAGDMSIDRCPQCHGIWLDACELEHLLTRLPHPLLQSDRHFRPAASEGPRRTCPHCKGTSYLIKLNSLIRPGTILDTCPVCFGVWLDAGELGQLAAPDLLSRMHELFTS